MKRHEISTRILAALALSAGATATQAALPAGTVLQFNEGVQSYEAYGNPIDVTSGSYFSVDLDGNGKITGIEKTPIAMHDGIVIGASQPAGGSHSGPVNGSESPGIDMPWNFFGNTGMFQTLSPVNDMDDGTLDFSGLGVTWNGIPNIPLGDPLRSPLPDTLRATLTCSSAPCGIGDTYVLDYVGHVPSGDPSGFGGVRFGLHLEGTIMDGDEFLRAAIGVDGGTLQECSGHGGSMITFGVSVSVPLNDSIAAIDWTLDGAPIGSGETVVAEVPLGVHTAAVEVRTVAGLAAANSINVTVRDTQPPVVSAAFLNRRGQAVTQVSRNAQLRTLVQAMDVCDPDPDLQAMVGAPVADGAAVAVQGKAGRIRLEVPQLTLSVTAQDASGNSASGGASVSIAP